MLERISSRYGSIVDEVTNLCRLGLYDIILGIGIDFHAFLLTTPIPSILVSFHNLYRILLQVRYKTLRSLMSWHCLGHRARSMDLILWEQADFEHIRWTCNPHIAGCQGVVQRLNVTILVGPRVGWRRLHIHIAVVFVPGRRYVFS